MKNFNFNSILSGLFFAALITFVSCSKDNNPINEQIKSEQTDFSFLENHVTLANHLSVNNGILQFNTIEDFRSSVLAANRMNKADFLQWETSLGFSSMQTTFEEIIQAEFDKEGSEKSELYHEKIQSGLIIPDDATGLYKLNIFNPAYASVLNEQGLVMVGHKLYQFGANALKTWEHADINQVNILLNANSKTPSINILTIPYQEVALRNTSQWSDECTSTNGDATMTLTASFFSDFVADGVPEVIFIDYSVNVAIMITNSSNELEYDPNARFELTGKSTTDLILTDGTEEYTKSIDELSTVQGVGGNQTYIPNVAGEYTSNAPLYFANPAKLMFSWWHVEAKSSLGTAHECEILM